MNIYKNKFDKISDKVSLKNYSPNDKLGYKGDKESALIKTKKLVEEMVELQELFYAQNGKRLLIVLQGMDTAGKDGTISHVFSGVNPQGVKVACFKKPTRIELARDYLWRVHFQVPRGGEITIFNRSHYEDVLTVRVHDIVSKDIWKKRYEHINNFEKMLSDEGTVIVKIFLHIDREEQTKRLQARLATKAKQWKLSTADLEERKFWKEYQKAYEAILEKTSTPWAPWYIVPSNDKWVRNLFISKLLVDTLKDMKLKAPKPDYDPSKIVID